MSFNSLFGLGSHSEDASLAGFWPLQDAAASTAVVDVSSNANDGVLGGGDNTADKDTTGPNGYMPSALQMNGTDDFITIALGAIDEPHTVMCWIKAANTDANQYFVSFSETHVNNRQFALVSLSSVFGFAARGGTGFLNASGSGVDTNWNHLAGVATANDARQFFFNGVASGTETTSLNITCVTLDIGRLGDSTPSAYESSTHAGLAFFTRVLIEAEIAEAAGGPEPINSVAPAETGTGTDGQTLSCTSGTWVLDSPFGSGTNGTITYAYQWTRSNDGIGTGEADIGSATASTYLLTGTDVGKFIRCRVRASNTGGFDAAADTNSNFSGEIQAAGNRRRRLLLVGAAA